MIRIEELTKTYGSVCAVDGVTFDVEPGKVTDFLGPSAGRRIRTSPRRCSRRPMRRTRSRLPLRSRPAAHAPGTSAGSSTTGRTRTSVSPDTHRPFPGRVERGARPVLPIGAGAPGHPRHGASGAASWPDTRGWRPASDLLWEGSPRRGRGRSRVTADSGRPRPLCADFGAGRRRHRRRAAPFATRWTVGLRRRGPATAAPRTTGSATRPRAGPHPGRGRGRPRAPPHPGSAGLPPDRSCSATLPFPPLQSARRPHRLSDPTEVGRSGLASGCAPGYIRQMVGARAGLG